MAPELSLQTISLNRFGPQPGFAAFGAASLLTRTLHAPAAPLGLIEGIADALTGVARLGGGGLADDPSRPRRSVAIGEYASTAVVSGLIGAAGSAWTVGLPRPGAWTTRGLHVRAATRYG